MPLSSQIVGQTGQPVVHRIDARWTMAYAAALGDRHAVYMDTRKRGDVLAHPLFPVCFEWPLFLDTGCLPATEELTMDERMRSVHATHDLHIHKPLRAGMTVSSRATVVRVEARKPGAYQVARIDSVDADGTPVCTTWYGSLMRGVQVTDGDRVEGEGEPELTAIEESVASTEEEIPVAAGAAHVYTECARIWNPIHTDIGFAAMAGLPDIILHGTATLALAVSRVIDRVLGGDAERVIRIGGRFRGMVFMPSKLTLRIFEGSGGVTRFTVSNDRGERAVGDGLLAARE